MQNDGSNKDGTTTAGGEQCGTSHRAELDLEKQDNTQVLPQEGSHRALSENSTLEGNPTLLTIVVCNGESPVTHVASTKEELPSVASPKKGYLSRNASSHEQCRYANSYF